MPTDTLTSDGTWTVPSGVDSITVRLWGGQGTSGEYSGGEGGFVEIEEWVYPGETFTYFVGTEAGQRDPGTDDWESPDDPGGGASVWLGGDGTAYDSFDDWLAAAAGGGGTSTNDADNAAGGDGGADTGEAGGNGTSPYGEGGSQSSGGAGGIGDTGGPDGRQGYGGGNSLVTGGGDGWYGGGGGARNYSSVTYSYTYYAAGGGSNYVDSSVTELANERGGNTGDGYIEVEYYQAPVAPSTVSVTVNGDDSFTVSWSGDENANNYRVQRQYDGGSWNTVATPNAGDRSITDTNANNANNVRYRVRTENTSGNSSYTYSPTVTTDPTGLTITGTDAGSVSLSWNGVDQPNSYEVQRSEGSGYSTVANPGGTTYTDTGLENGEQYTYRVRANYSETDSDFTGTVSATTSLPSPTIDGLDATTDREITVSYTCPDNSTDGDLSIERSRDGGNTWTTLATITARNWSGAYTDTGLLDGEQYTYRLIRSTDHRTSRSSEPSATSNLPAPTGLTADNVGSSSIAVSWSATHNYGETLPQIKPADASNWTTDATLDPSDTDHTFTGVRNGEKYDIRVVASTEHDATEDT